MKLVKKILIAVCVPIVIVVILALPMVLTMLSFTPAKTGAITEDFYAVKDKFITMFVLRSGDDLICFDAANTPSSVEAGFRELGLEPLKVKAVFLTHSDGDHVNGLPLFRNAAVYLPEKEEPLVTGAVKRKFMFMKRTNKLPVEKYLLIKDGEQLEIGKAVIKAVLTPGHTIGSTSYLVNGKYLVVGDLAVIRKGKLAGMPKPPSEDPAEINKSLELIGTIGNVEYIATAHGGVLKAGKKRE